MNSTAKETFYKTICVKDSFHSSVCARTDSNDRNYLKHAARSSQRSLLVPTFLLPGGCHSFSKPNPEIRESGRTSHEVLESNCHLISNTSQSIHSSKEVVLKNQNHPFSLTALPGNDTEQASATGGLLPDFAAVLETGFASRL